MSELSDHMDDDGYPTEETLRRIREWPRTDYDGLMEFIRPLWAYAEAGYWDQEGPEYYLSTAGWSGNEDIIGALEENFWFWTPRRSNLVAPLNGEKGRPDWTSTPVDWKASVHRIASHDEHGLPVIPRAADMPKWAKYRVRHQGIRVNTDWECVAEFYPCYESEEWQCVEDYQGEQR